MNTYLTHKTHIWTVMIAFSLLTLILTSCSFPGVVSTSAQLPQVSKTPPTTSLPPIRLPQDEAAHKDLTEWWYYTGHLNATDARGEARHYGFELVVFQLLRSTFPPLYIAHFAISDITRGEFHYDQQLQTEPNAILPNGSSTQGINVGIGDWTIQGLNGHDQLAAWMQNYTMQLNLTSLKPPTFHNGNGLITLGSGGFSYYYSRTRMVVGGTLIDHNQALQVTGLAWMDHQWGNFLTTVGGGWDWYSVQLNNDTEMMIYAMRDAQGTVLTTYTGYIDTNGVDHLLPANTITTKVFSHWTSPKTGITYPSGWQLGISQLQATLTLLPQLQDQELVVAQSTGNPYWEGAVSINGSVGGKRIAGQGYVELTGYTR